MNIGELNNNDTLRKTIITHFLIWLLYLVMQFVWRFDTYSIYDITAATIQVMTWVMIFGSTMIYTGMLSLLNGNQHRITFKSSQT